jgi:hypothetical protein
MQPTIQNLILHGTTDYLIVQADSRVENSLNLKGEGGETVSLAIDGELDDEHRRIWGTVLAVPKRITADKILFHEDNKPVRMDQIQMDVHAGSKLYFSYLALQDSTELAPNVYAVSYADAICVVRNGEIVPIGSHVLLKPVYPEGVEEVDKGVMGRVNSFGMVTEVNIPPIPFQGIVAHTGLPLKNREDILTMGMHVGIDKYQYGQHYHIEGEDYLVCRQKDISCIFE